MAVFRIEKARDYTVMSNHHLRSTQLSLKAKGLLSLMLSARGMGVHHKGPCPYLQGRGRQHMRQGAGAGGTGLSLGKQKGGNVQNKLLMKMQEKSKNIDMVFSRYNVKIILSVLLKEGLSRVKNNTV